MTEDGILEISVISTTEEATLQNSFLNASKRNYIKYCICGFFQSLLPNKKQLNIAITQFFVLFFFSGSVFGILVKNALPGSEVFALLLLAFLSFLGGQIFGILRLPPLVGMLIVGFLYRNLSFIPFSRDISQKTASVLRDIALVIILLSSGIGVDGRKLCHMKRVVMQLTCIPLLIEVGAMTILSHFFLELPWVWGVMLGFIISAVSIAVVLPILLRLQKKKLGNDKGIPTLILAASSMDDIVAITGFTVTLSLVFSEGNSLTVILIKTSLEPLVGCAFGAVFGVIFWHFPSKEMTKGLIVYYHILLLCFGGLSAMFVGDQLRISGSGALGCITLAFVSAIGWRKDPKKFACIESVLGILWKVIEPFMFSLIGSEISLTSIHSHIGYSILCLFLALLCRMLITPFVTLGANLNMKEKIFVSCAWLPKAAVQAAIGSQALDFARLNEKGNELIGYSEQILTVSVLSIVITAPLGAALTSSLGPILLSKDLEDIHHASSVNQDEEDEGIENTEVKNIPMNYGACRQLQPSDILPSKAET